MKVNYTHIFQSHIEFFSCKYYSYSMQYRCLFDLPVVEYATTRKEICVQMRLFSSYICYDLILTTSKKKSTWGRLCTKNRTGCRSIVTLTVKSCGVPGLTVFLGIASWCEWINVSSKSNTNVLRWTMLKRCRDTGDSGNRSYFTGWYWTN